MTGDTWPDGTKTLLRDVLVDAYGDDEQLWALRQAFADDVQLPDHAFVLSVPVTVVEFDYDGNTRRGLTARVAGPDGREHVVAASDVSFVEGSQGHTYVAAYRMWQGLEPMPAPMDAAVPRPRRPKVTDDDLDLAAPIDLVVLAPRESAVRCRLLGTAREITLRTSSAWNTVPGEILAVQGRKYWRFNGHPYLSGDVESHRLDVRVLDLAPLRLQDEWPWDPNEEPWTQGVASLEAWARSIVAHGPRSSFEMEQVPSGGGPEDPDSDPILEAIEQRDAGDPCGAERRVVDLLASDLRCLDAHACLGYFAFGYEPEKAIRHYEAGVRIGELALGDGFDDVLPWDRIDNRPFLRCLHGFGLCLRRLGRTEEAVAIFERMLWLNPADEQEVRHLLQPVCSGESWEGSADDGMSWKG